MVTVQTGFELRLQDQRDSCRTSGEFIVCQIMTATQGCLPMKPEEGSKLQQMWNALTGYKIMSVFPQGFR